MSTQGPHANVVLASWPAAISQFSIELFSSACIIQPGKGEVINALCSAGTKLRAPLGQHRVLELDDVFHAYADGEDRDGNQPHCYCDGDVLVVPQRHGDAPRRIPEPAVRSQLVLEVPSGFAGKIHVRAKAHARVRILRAVPGVLFLSAENGGQIMINASGPFGWAAGGPPNYGACRRFDGVGIHFANHGTETADGSYAFEWISASNGWFGVVATAAYHAEKDFELDVRGGDVTSFQPDDHIERNVERHRQEGQAPSKEAAAHLVEAYACHYASTYRAAFVRK